MYIYIYIYKYIYTYAYTNTFLHVCTVIIHVSVPRFLGAQVPRRHDAVVAVAMHQSSTAGTERCGD